MKVEFQLTEKTKDAYIIDIDESDIRNFLAAQGKKFTNFQWALLLDLIKVSDSQFVLERVDKE